MTLILVAKAIDTRMDMINKLPRLNVKKLFYSAFGRKYLHQLFL
jgi:hypothetical protein